MLHLRLHDSAALLHLRLHDSAAVLHLRLHDSAAVLHLHRATIGIAASETADLRWDPAANIMRAHIYDSYDNTHMMHMTTRI